MESYESECSICTLGYDKIIQKPMLLSCGHTICIVCLEHQLKEVTQNQKEFERTKDPVYKNKSIQKRECYLCKRPVISSLDINDYNVNSGIIDILSANFKVDTRPSFDLKITICCAPPHINLHIFQQQFLAQLDIQHQGVTIKNQDNSFIGEKIIVIDFANIKNRSMAVISLEGKIFRQSEIELNMYAIVSNKDPQLSDAFKFYMNHCDFAFIQNGVPMLRDKDFDLIRINNVPYNCKYQDVNALEYNLRNSMAQDAENLTVRQYNEDKHTFIVIYLGGCRKIKRVIDILISRPITFQRQKFHLTQTGNEQFPNIFELDI